MNIRIKFLGGAGSVTGSKYLLEIDDFKLLIDCGLFQGLKELRLRNWADFPVDTNTIDAVVLTHAHIDHSGYLPRLFKQGFSGPVYCTEPTVDLLDIMLKDAGKLQMEEAIFARKKGYSKHEYPQPLFTVEDAENVMPAVVGVPYATAYDIHPRVRLKYNNSGHILGAAIVELIVKGDSQEKKIVFSGDLGPYSDPLHFSPESVREADILFVESTYGNRQVEKRDLLDELHHLLLRCEDRGGSLIIPAFSVGRTQLMLYYFWKLHQSGKMPDWPVFVDSPMAISVTSLYRKFSSLHKLRDNTPEDGHYIFDHPLVHYIKDQGASRELNERARPFILLSASGMVTGGRILHHLFHRLKQKKDTVLFTGYQAVGSRGRKILEGEPEVKIFGEQVPVLAHIESMQGFSAHGDQEDLMRWINQFERSPKITFIVHGEAEAANGLSQRIEQEMGWRTIIPTYLENVQLFEGI